MQAMNRRKQVAYIGIKSLPSKAGVDRVVEAIVRGIDKTHYHPVVYCSRRAMAENQVAVDPALAAIQIIAVPTLPGKHLNALSLFFFSALHALCFGHYDLIHLHNVEAAFVLPLLRLRYKVISTSHGETQARDKWSRTAKLMLRLAEYPYAYLSNCLTSVSKPLAAAYEARYHRPVHYLPNGVEEEVTVDQAAAARILAEYGIEPGNFILFAAGRILATKGCHYLLEAFRQLDDNIPLLIVGDASHIPAYAEELRRLADRRVHFVPFIDSKAALFGLVSAAKLFVFPSTVEGMSMMMLEVASLGVPLICSDIPENVSALPEQALYFQSGNVPDLEDKLRWALHNPGAMHALAQRAYDWVSRSYRWRDIVGRYEALYTNVS